MPVKTNHQKSIDGIVYTTETFPTSDGLVLIPKLLALFGEALVGLFFATEDDTRDDLLANPKVLANVVGTIAKRAADPDGIFAGEGLLVLKDLLKATQADKVAIGDAEVPASVFDHFDSHLRGRFKHLMEVAMWVGQVNFGEP